MKNIVTLIFFASASVHAQSTFQLDVNRLQIPTDFDQTSDHGFIIGGNMLDTLSGLDDVYSLVKIDSLGNEQWAGMYYDMGHDSYVSSVFQSSDGNYVFSGYPDDLFTHQCVVAKINTNGHVMWAINFGIPGYSSAIKSQSIETNDGKYAVTFNQSASMFNPMYTSLVKLDPYGNTLWEKNYQDTDYLGISQSIANTSDNGFILTGTSYGINYYAPYLLRTDSLGNPLWCKAYIVAPYNVPGASAIQTRDGGFLITCSSFSSGGIANIIKTDSVGDIQWTTTISGTELHSLNSVEQTSDSNYVFTGSVGDYNNNTQRLLLVKMDQAGDTIWTRTYQSGNGTNLGGVKVLASNDGGLLSLNMRYIVTQIVKTDSGGYLNCDQSFSLTTVQHNSSSSFTGNLLFDSVQTGTNTFLYQGFYPPSTIIECSSVNVDSVLMINGRLNVYPNPASEKLSLVSNDEIESATVFSMLGKILLTATNKTEIDVSSLSDGIYLIRVKTRLGSRTMQFIKQR